MRAETRDDLLKDDGSGLNDTISRANRLFKKVKQTNDATLDSRLLVNVSDLAYKKTAALVLGDTSTGVDVDEFLSKCISYMRNGGPLSCDENVTSGSRPRRTNAEDLDGEDEDMIGEALDWEFLGRHACFPYNSRPPVPSFLLGPLSVEKKQRTQTQRKARNAKDTAGREARPEALSREDLNQSEKNGLTAICTRIRTQLNRHISNAEHTISAAGFRSMDDLQTQRGKAMLKKVRMCTNGGVGLFDFVVNPRSFGQTVENLFYVSFLIKEGAFGVQNDEEGLPTISELHGVCPCKRLAYSILTELSCSTRPTLHARTATEEQILQTPSRLLPRLRHLAEPHRGVRNPRSDDPTPAGRRRRDCGGRAEGLVWLGREALRWGSYWDGAWGREGGWQSGRKHVRTSTVIPP